jgi:hypothetical protein
MITKTKLFLLSLLCVAPLYSYAAEVTINLEPSSPEPYSKVTLTLVSYDMNVDTSMVVWRVGGKEAKRGLGERSFSLSTGAVGVVIPVSATVSDAAGNVITSSINIDPESVSLVWEAPESYIPPFYEGKALPSDGASVRIIAVPNMRVPASSLSYTWFVEDQAISSASGAGKQSLVTNLDTLADTTNIRVVVRTPQGATAEKTLSLSPHRVMPMVYSYDELLGTNFAVSFKRRLELAKDITLSLEPFYLSTKNGLESAAKYSWYVDGLPVTPEEKTLLALRPKADTYGVRNLSIVLENARRRLQKAQADLQIVFDTRQ